MTNKNRQAEDREALERLLDIHGADRTRWPARERLRFAGVISDDAEAAGLVAEAQALDRLLDMAPRASAADIDALKERIVAAALRSQRPQLTTIAGGGKSIPANKPAPAKAWRGQLRRPAWGGNFVEWPAAAVLAASLVLGVMLGSAGTFDATMREVAQVTGFDSSTTDNSQLALGEDIYGQTDEDLL